MVKDGERQQTSIMLRDAELYLKHGTWIEMQKDAPTGKTLCEVFADEAAASAVVTGKAPGDAAKRAEQAAADAVAEASELRAKLWNLTAEHDALLRQKSTALNQRPDDVELVARIARREIYLMLRTLGDRLEASGIAVSGATCLALAGDMELAERREKP